jgi:hypothetical protein
MACMTVLESTGTGTDTPVLRLMASCRRISTSRTTPSILLSAP